MFDHIRQALAEQRDGPRPRAEPGRRLTAEQVADRTIAKQAPRWKVLTNAAGRFTLLWEVAPGWYQHAWGDSPALLVSDTEAEATAHVGQNASLMTGTVNRALHPEWTDEHWERERVENNHAVFDTLEAAGFDACQDADWRN